MTRMAETFKVVPRLYIEGRAIAVDLSGTTPLLPSYLPRLHMSVLWRGTGYTSGELAAVQLEATQWTNATVEFTIKPWGSRSWLIEGDLQMMGEALRTKFGKWNESDRPMHVELGR
jgi:hypothetical protein